MSDKNIVEIHLPETLDQLSQDIDDKYTEVQRAKADSGLTVGITEMLRQARRPLPWVIESILIADTLTVIYGPPKQYKTFIALDMALSQATGLPFLGAYEVLETGLVIYAAGEGVAGISQRVLAWCIERGIEEINEDTVPFRRTSGPIQVNSGGAAFLAEECARISDLMQKPIAGIYIDTLARNFGEGDESKTQDMSTFVQQCDYHLRQRFGSPVIVVHHTGHDNATRARGSIVLMASADAQFRVTADHPRVFFEPDFMKDAEAPDAHVLTCEKIALGFDDQFGNPVKSVVLRMTDEAMPAEEIKVSRDERIGLERLSDDWKSYQIWRDDWFFEAEKVVMTSGKNRGKRRNKSGLRTIFARVLESLVEKRLIEVQRNSDGSVESVRTATDSEA